MIVYLAQDIPPFAMYCVYGESGSSLLIESTNSVISEDVEDSVSGYCSLSEEVTHALLDEVVENCEIVKYVRKLNTVDRDGKLAGAVIFSYNYGRKRLSTRQCREGLINPRCACAQRGL